MTTFSAKPQDIEHKWFVVDATDLVLGRLASEIAHRLKGKHKPYYTANLDCGDYIIVTNAEKIHLTGAKAENKKFFWHTGFPGGIKERIAGKVLKSKHPERVLAKAVDRMMDRGPLGRNQLKKLYIYAGNEHPHTAQMPEVIDFAAANPKNKKRK